ncbi:MAG: hypothetical protein JJLCMIEE_00342 [Acidimicrobiales bacterium]|nr:MAG: hypothetical protein EDR02_17735 [Actinomycetota bacterium]MBV6507301.1 hypothetical protein [Acidimicrobiales bacterium]RIK04090.1 MAG: hypothetical protein DCC48_14320 [Acidobacteriota bacterium]
MSTEDLRPFDPRSVRYQPLVWFLRVATLLAFLLAVAATFAPSPLDKSFAIATAALLVAAPLVRIAWLIIRWWRRRDLLFVSVGVALLLVVAGGGFVAAAIS